MVVLDAARAGAGSFTVSNVTGRPVRARLLVLPGAGADASWFQVEGESERMLPVAGTTTVDVSVRLKDSVPAGSYSFVLGAALEESPDQVVPGPTVSFEAKPGRRRFPWWIVIVAAAAVLLLAAGGILIWSLTRPAAEPTTSPTPTQAGPPVYLSDVFLATPDMWFDLDESRSTGVPVGGEDVYFYQGAGSGELGVVGQGPPRLAIVDEPTFAACEAATGYDDLAAQNVVLLPDRETFVCVRFTDQLRRAVMSIGPLTGDGFPVSYTTWERD
jgi:hypothetical protein